MCEWPMAMKSSMYVKAYCIAEAISIYHFDCHEAFYKWYFVNLLRRLRAAYQRRHVFLANERIQ